MFEQILKKEIPSKINAFAKLTAGHDPYHFASWDKDGNNTILRYWFWNKTKTKQNRKRVFIDEMEKLMRSLLVSRTLTRTDFKKYCPRTQGDGSCGYAVIIGIFKYFQILDVKDGEYTVKNTNYIEKLVS